MSQPSALKALAASLILIAPVSANSWFSSDTQAHETIRKLKAELAVYRDTKAHLDLKLKVYEINQKTTLESNKRLRRENRILRLKLLHRNEVPPESWADVVQRHREQGDVILGITPVIDAIEAAGGPDQKFIHFDSASIKILKRQLHTLAQVDGWVASALEQPVPTEDLEAFSQRTASLSSYADNLAERIAAKLSRLSPSHLKPAAFQTDEAFRTDSKASMHQLQADDVDIDLVDSD